MDPANLLFKDPDKKVFKNQAELVQLLMENEHSEYLDKKESTIRSLLSKTIRGDRRITPKLKRSILDIINSLPLDKDRVKYLNDHLLDSFERKYDEATYIQKNTEGGKITTGLFDRLEFEGRDVVVKCITSNLNWANNHIDKIIEAAQKNNNNYQYLVVDRVAKSYGADILEKVRKKGVGSTIEIKFMFEHIGFVSINSTKRERIYTGDIIFPLMEDLVIYRNLPDEFREILHLERNDIVVTGTRIYKSNHQMQIADTIESEDTKVRLAIDWFDTMWNAIG